MDALKAELIRMTGQLESLKPILVGADVGVLHRATGNAITTWAIMEERLVMIASLLLKTMPEKTGLIFYSIINFQVWIAIITELFDLEPDFSPFRRRWNKLYERLRAEKDIRDSLAHHAVLSATVSDNKLPHSIKRASRIDMRAKSRALKPLNAIQVNYFSERIGTISDDLLTLVDDMTAHVKPAERPPSPDKSSAPNSDQVQ